ncbi:hypothetical protein OESDEN_03568, partial [Oesophagostomum dentatum]
LQKSPLPGPLAVIRRFSSRLGFGHKANAATNPAPEAEEKPAEKEDREHVTIIRVKTVHRKKEEQKSTSDATSSQGDEDEDELRIYAQESILKRLMEEKAMIEKQMGNISMEWGSESARTSIDEASDIIVERF